MTVISEDWVADQQPGYSLPAPYEVANTTVATWIEAGLAISAAYMIMRAFVAHGAQQLMAPAPGAAEIELKKIWGRFAPLWAQMVSSIVVQLWKIGSIATASPAELEDLAATYAGMMGEYLSQSSLEAVVDAYNAGLNKGWNSQLAWQRASYAYGLDKPAIKSYLAKLDTQGLKTELIDTAAKKAVDTAILKRADLFGQEEAFTAKELGKQITWLSAQARGELPSGTRKVWRTAEDERVCILCAPLDGKDKALSGIYKSGKWHGFTPTIHPNCRCTIELSYPEFVQKDYDPNKHPRGGDAENRGRFSHTWGAKVTEREAGEAEKLIEEAAEKYKEPVQMFVKKPAQMFAPKMFEKPKMFPAAMFSPMAMFPTTMFEPKKARRVMVVFVDGQAQRQEAPKPKAEGLHSDVLAWASGDGYLDSLLTRWAGDGAIVTSHSPQEREKILNQYFKVGQTVSLDMASYFPGQTFAIRGHVDTEVPEHGISLTYGEVADHARAWAGIYQQALRDFDPVDVITETVVHEPDYVIQELRTKELKNIINTAYDNGAVTEEEFSGLQEMVDRNELASYVSSKLHAQDDVFIDAAVGEVSEIEALREAILGDHAAVEASQVIGYEAFVPTIFRFVGYKGGVTEQQNPLEYEVLIEGKYKVVNSEVKPIAEAPNDLQEEVWDAMYSTTSDYLAAHTGNRIEQFRVITLKPVED